MSSRTKIGDRSRTHGLTRAPIYNVYRAMRSRCYDKSNRYYCNYGERGIKVCDEWSTFEGFYSDMGGTYQHGLTIERLNNNGNYCPENCIWATRTVQANNTSQNRLETVDGITDTVANHARRYGHTYSTVQHRLQRNWNVEEAFKAPRIRQ